MLVLASTATATAASLSTYCWQLLESSARDFSIELSFTALSSGVGATVHENGVGGAGFCPHKRFLCALVAAESTILTTSGAPERLKPGKALTLNTSRLGFRMFWDVGPSSQHNSMKGSQESLGVCVPGMSTATRFASWFRLCRDQGFPRGGDCVRRELSLVQEIEAQNSLSSEIFSYMLQSF